MLTAWPKPACFSTGKPWSWYMTSTASARASSRGTKAVSAGTGPCTSSPALRAAAMAGAITARSSSPSSPSSPAWGFSPQTAMRGAAMPNLSRRSACMMCSTSISSAVSIASGTARSGRWVVASATRRVPATSIITGRDVPQRSARYSVCPENATPDAAMVLFWTGAVTIASQRPSRSPASAASSSASTWPALRGSGRPAVQGTVSG